MRGAIRTVIVCLCVGPLLFLASCQSSNHQTVPGRESVSARPGLNLLLVTIDTLRADRLGCYGYSKIETPNLDQLAREGVLFEKAITNPPLTAPSHASIFTGLYPTVHEVRDTGGFILQSCIRPWRRSCSSRGGKRRRLSGLRCSKSSSGSTRDSRSTTTRCQEPNQAKLPGNMPSGGRVRSTGLSRGLAHSRENLSCSGCMCLIHTLPMIRRLPFGKNTADGSTTEKWLTPTMNWVGCSRLSPGSRRHGIP